MRIVSNKIYLFKYSTDSSMRFLYHSRGNAYLVWDCIYIYTQEFWSYITTFKKDHYMLDDISYLYISFGILMKNEMIHIILLAKYYINFIHQNTKD